MTITEAFKMLKLDIQTVGLDIQVDESELLLKLNCMYAGHILSLKMIEDGINFTVLKEEEIRLRKELEAIKVAHKYVFVRMVREGV